VRRIRLHAGSGRLQRRRPDRPRRLRSGLGALVLPQRLGRRHHHDRVRWTRLRPGRDQVAGKGMKMSKQAAALVVGFALSALAVPGDVARGASPSREKNEIQIRLSEMRFMAESVKRGLDAHAAEAAAGGMATFSAAEDARLTREVASLQGMLAELGPQASLQDHNAVAQAADRLRLMRGEEPAAFTPSFGPMAGAGAGTGTVTNQNTAAPIAGVTVYIYDCAGRYITGAVTNASGVYTTAAVLETGTYYSYAYLPGFALEIYSDVLLPINDDITNGTPINVTSGATTSNINYSLLPAGSAGGISGTITNAGTAAPVATSIYVFDAAGGFVDSTSSNGAGAYTTVTPLKTGTYYVYAYGTGRPAGDDYNHNPGLPHLPCNPTARPP